MKRLSPPLFLLTSCLAACAHSPMSPHVVGPRVAHHQHLISPAFAPLVHHDPIDASALLRMMDEAGSERGVVLSMAYSFADERKMLPDPETLVRQENDWTAAQVATAPRRLQGFCGVNPLTPHAMAEIERCTRLPGMKGVKLHLGNSGVDLHDPRHVARLRGVFALAGQLEVPIIVHLRSRSGSPYGADEARLFLREVLPAARGVTVQIAHLAGSGPGHSADADAAIGVFVDALARQDPVTRGLIFDVTTVASEDASAEECALVARRLREIGLDRIVFGSDMHIGDNPALAPSWELFERKIPLTSAEFRRIASNQAPYIGR